MTTKLAFVQRTCGPVLRNDVVVGRWWTGPLEPKPYIEPETPEETYLVMVRVDADALNDGIY